MCGHLSRWIKFCALAASTRRRFWREDLENGLLLLEDFGDDLYSRVLPARADELEIYQAAVEVLDNLPAAELPPYSLEKMLNESITLVDWFAPEADREGFLAIWQALISQLGAG